MIRNLVRTLIILTLASSIALGWYGVSNSSLAAQMGAGGQPPAGAPVGGAAQLSGAPQPPAHPAEGEASIGQSLLRLFGGVSFNAGRVAIVVVALVLMQKLIWFISTTPRPAPQPR